MPGWALPVVVVRWNLAAAPTVESYSGRPPLMVVEDPAKSVRKPPGSMIVTLMPRGAVSLASAPKKPSTPHFAAEWAASPHGSDSPTDG